MRRVWVIEKAYPAIASGRQWRRVGLIDAPTPARALVHARRIVGGMNPVRVTPRFFTTHD